MNYGPGIIPYCSKGKEKTKFINLESDVVKKEHTEYKHHLDQSLHNTAQQLHYPPASFIT